MRFKVNFGKLLIFILFFWVTAMVTPTYALVVAPIVAISILKFSVFFAGLASIPLAALLHILKRWGPKKIFLVITPLAIILGLTIFLILKQTKNLNQDLGRSQMQDFQDRGVTVPSPPIPQDLYKMQEEAEGNYGIAVSPIQEFMARDSATYIYGRLLITVGILSIILSIPSVLFLFALKKVVHLNLGKKRLLLGGYFTGFLLAVFGATIYFLFLNQEMYLYFY